jgi:hypothetical protein
MGAVAAGAFALHEKHAEQKDPTHAHRHKIEEKITATVAVGEGGYVFHEHLPEGNNQVFPGKLASFI